MPSPFPGMNPFLEQPSVWEDFHSRFMTYAGESLTAQIRPNFLVKLEERVFIHEPSSVERRKLLGKPVETLAPAFNDVQSIMATIPDIDIERHVVIEIRDRQDRPT